MTKKFRTGKRVLSLFLAALLVVTMLPTSLLTALADTATDTDAEVTEATSDSSDSSDSSESTETETSEGTAGSDTSEDSDTSTAEASGQSGTTSWTLDDVDASGWWVAHSAAIEVTEDGVLVTFHSDSLNYTDEATNSWNIPVVVAYTANAVFGGGEGIGSTDGFCEYAVIRSDAYGWCTNSSDFYYDTAFDEWDDDWDAWLAACVAGVDCTVYAYLQDGYVIAQLTVNGITTTMHAQVDTSCPTYISLSGEYCTLTDITVSSCYTEVAEISEETFPDENFRSYISENIDTNGDGILSGSEVSRTTRIEVSYCGISDLTGISYFTDLECLNVVGNDLTSLDLTENTALTELYAESNQLTEIQISNCTKLVWLSLGGNALESVDLSSLTELSDLLVDSNNLSEIDVSNNPKLTVLHASGNQLTSLDVSNNPNLTVLYVGGNQLTELDLSNNPNLTNLYVYSNQLTSLDVSSNPDLAILYADGNQLTELDLSNNTKLTYVSCNYNALTSLDVSMLSNLTELYCDDNALTSLDVSGLSNLTELYCARNALTALDCSGLSNLVSLVCRENLIADLILTGCTSLEYLENGSGCVSEIDLSDCVNLIFMSLGSNALTSIDLSNNTKLQTLYLDTNPDLTDVDLAGLVELQYLVLYNTGIEILNIGGLSGVLWYLDVSNCTSLIALDASCNALTELNVSGCTALASLRLDNNNLKSLYLLDCTELTELSATGNHLTSLCLTGLTNLMPDYVFLYDNSYSITLTSEDRSWSLWNLDFGQIGFNADMVSNMTGATADADDSYLIYVDEDADTVYYCYDTENENYIYLDVTLTVEVGTVEINEENFPDENFRSYICELDQNGDGWLSDNEIANVTYMDVSWRGISDMTGLSYFTNLEYLDVSYNNLWELDVTALVNLKTLRCTSNEWGNYISSIDLSQNTALESLTMNYERTEDELGPLTELDLSGHTALTYLDITFQSFSSLDLTGCTGLTEINLQGCYNLESLDLSDLTEMDYLIICQTNLTTIDLSQNTKLVTLDAWQTQLTSLDLSNLTELTFLNLNDSRLTELDVTNNTALTYLDVSYNELTELDVTNNTALTQLHVTNNQLTELDVTNNTALTNLSVAENNLTALDVTQNTELTVLYAWYNNLTELDVSRNGALNLLYVSDNQLTYLDLTNNTEITAVDLSYNQLTTLDVSRNVNLESLVVVGNQLTGIDVSQNTALQTLSLSYNQLEDLDISALTNLVYLYVNGNQLTGLDLSNNTALRQLYADSNQLTSLDLSACTALEYLYVPYNSLTSLDVSDHTSLWSVDAGSNALTSLNVEGCTALETLWVATNELSGVDLSTNTALHYLWISDNDLVTLDTTACTELEYAWVYNNPLVSLDMAGCNNFWELQSYNQTYYISADEIVDGVYDLSTLVNVYGLDLSRTCGSESGEETESSILYWDNGYVDTEALTLTFDDGCSSVSYNYDCGNGWTIYVTIEAGAVEINEENFPDDAFRSYVSGYLDWNGDGTLSQSEIEGATSVDAAWWNISDLTGIEYLTELTYLNVGENPISVLDLTANTKLEEVYCSENASCWDGTTTVNVSGLTNLRTLELSNSNVTELNVSGCTALQYLNCAYSQLTAVDISECTALTYLYIYDSSLGSIDLGSNTNLTVVDVSNNDLTTLDVSMLSNLNYLYCYGNSLTSVDVTNLYNLMDLNVGDNYIMISASDLSVDEDGNEYFDLTTLEAYGFDISRMSSIWCETDGWVEYDGESIVYIHDNAGCIAYTYHCGDCDNNVNGDDYYRDFRIYITVTVDFDLNYDTEETVDSITVARNTSAYDWNGIVGLEREHYTFTGWYTAPEDEADGFNFDYVTESTTVYAHWDIDTYPVSYDYNYNGGEDLDYTAYVGWNEAAAEPETPEREGYDFCGWYDRSTSQAYDFSTPVTGDVSLYAKWTLKTFTIIFDANGGTLASVDAATQTVKYGATASEPVNPTLTGYIFAGWFTGTGEDAEEYDFSQTVTEDITLYAHWTTKNWTVSFNANWSGAEDIADLTVANGATAEEPTAIVRVGYSYIWCEFGTTTEYDFDTPVTGNLELYAKWTRASYTVTFDANGGSLNDSETITVRHNAAIAEPADPTKTGYIFKGWYTEDGEAYDFDTLVTANLTLTAKWQVKTYAVTFDTNGGTLDVDGEALTYITDTAYYGTALEQPEDPTRTGYTFTGWYIVGTVDMYDFDALVSGEVHLYAGWSRNTCTVTFDANGGTNVPAAQTVKYGSRATEPTDPTYAGYTFDGWYTEDGTLFDFDTTLITESVTLYAQWTSEGGEVEEPIVITSQPENVTTTEGSTVTLSITAEGNGLSYKWYYLKEGAANWSSWSKDTANLTLTATSAWNGMQIYCMITDADGNTLQSDTITVSFGTDDDGDEDEPAITITSQPQNVETTIGGTVALSITAEGDGLSYKWYYLKAGAASWSLWSKDASNLYLTATSAWDGMKIYCLITDENGNTLQSETITVTLTSEDGDDEENSSIIITSQPENITTTAGSTVTLGITAEGDGLSYKWYYKKSGASNWGSWSKDTAALTLTATSSWNGMQIYCEITDSEGNTATSNTITVTIE